MSGRTRGQPWRAAIGAGAPRSVGDHRGVLLVLRHVKIDANEDALARDVEAREGDLLHGHSVRSLRRQGEASQWGDRVSDGILRASRDTSMHFPATTFFGTSLLLRDET